LANSGRLLAHAQLEIRRERGRDAALAVLLAREAVREGESTVAIGALREALAAHVPSVEANFLAARSTNYLPGSEESAWLDFSLSPASVSPLDDLIITPTGNNAVIWSAGSGGILQTLAGHTGLVGSASFSPNGRLAVTTSADNSARVWDLSKTPAVEIQKLEHTQMLNGAVFNPSGTLLVTLGDDDVAKVWTVGDYSAPRCTLESDGNFILATFSRDQTMLATVTHLGGTWEGQVWMIAADGCPRVNVPTLGGIDVRWLSFSGAGNWLGAVTVQGEAIVLSAPDWNPQARITPRVRYDRRDDSGDRPPPLAWSHDGRFVATAWGNTVYLAEIAAGTRAAARELWGHTDRVTSIAFNSADDRLLTTSRDGTARVWAFDEDKRILERIVLNEQDAVGSGVFASKDDRIVTAGDGGKVRSWKPLFAFRGLKPGTPSAAVRPASMQSVGSARSLRWFVEGTWVSTATATALVSHRDDLRMDQPSWSFQSPRFLERTADGFNVADSQEPGKRQLLAESDRFFANDLAGVSPGGRFLFARRRGDVSGGISVWDLNSQARPEVMARQDGCAAMAIADDKTLAWYCSERDLVLLALVGKPLVGIAIPDRVRVQSIRFSTDGRLVALAMKDYSVRVFDSTTQTLSLSIKSYGRPIAGMDFSADDRFLVSTSDDSTARIWDVATGTQIAVATTSASRLSGAAFSSGGGSLLLFTPDGALLWRCYACADVGGLLDEVRQRQIVRPLLPGEEARFGVTSADLNADRRTPAPPPPQAARGVRR
jgi:WD40 repeat protein